MNLKTALKIIHTNIFLIIIKDIFSNNNNSIDALTKTQIKNKTEYNEFLVIEQQAAEKIKRNCIKMTI